MALGQEEVGRRIRSARKAAKLTQRQLADLIGLGDSQSISNYERGINEVTVERLRQIAEATKHPLSHFIDEESVSQPAARPADDPVLARLDALQEQVAELAALLRDQAGEAVRRAGNGGSD